MPRLLRLLGLLCVLVPGMAYAQLAIPGSRPKMGQQVISSKVHGDVTITPNGSASVNSSHFAVNLATGGNGGVTGNLPVTNLNSGTSASSSTFWRGDGTWAAPAGSGTITASPQYDVPYYSASGTASTITGVAITGLQLDGTSGAPAAYGGVTCSANQWLTGLNASGAANSCTQPGAANISAGTFSGSFTFSSAPTMSGANISANTIPIASLAQGTSGNLIIGQGASAAAYTAMSGGATITNAGVVTLGNPGASTLGGIESATAPSHQFATGANTSGVWQFAQPGAGDIAAGTFAGAFTFSTAPTMSGANITSATIPSSALANSGVSAASYTPANITVNAQGQVTVASSNTYVEARSVEGGMFGNGGL